MTARLSPQMRERERESEKNISALTPGLLPPYQNPGDSPEGPGPLGLTSPLFMATSSEFPESCAPWMLRLALLGSPWCTHGQDGPGLSVVS